MIDYDKMQREFPKQKAALTRALKSGDYDKVVETCRKTVAEWGETGSWPDDWARWDCALSDAWWAARRQYVDGKIEVMPPEWTMRDLDIDRVARIAEAHASVARQKRNEKVALIKSALADWYQTGASGHADEAIELLAQLAGISHIAYDPETGVVAIIEEQP